MPKTDYADGSKRFFVAERAADYMVSAESDPYVTFSITCQLPGDAERTAHLFTIPQRYGSNLKQRGRVYLLQGRPILVNEGIGNNTGWEVDAFPPKSVDLKTLKVLAA